MADAKAWERFRKEIRKSSDSLLDRMETLCTCWVKSRPREEQFGLRWGAHSISCPIFSVSRDPVDEMKDDENREYGEAHFA